MLRTTKKRLIVGSIVGVSPRSGANVLQLHRRPAHGGGVVPGTEYSTADFAVYEVDVLVPNKTVRSLTIKNVHMDMQPKYAVHDVAPEGWFSRLGRAWHMASLVFKDIMGGKR